MRSLIFLIASLISVASFGQSFEGKIVYQNNYKSKLPNVTDEQFTTMMGSRQEYFIKDGDYKSLTNGSYFQWQLYVNKDNKLYNKMGNSESLLWNDGAVNSDTLIKAEFNKGVTEILGYKCDELILTTKSSKQKYYFTPMLTIDPTLFVNHKFGNWYEYVSRARAHSLKAVTENAQFILENVATEVKPMKLEKAFFALPADTKTMKSPY